MHVTHSLLGDNSLISLQTNHLHSYALKARGLKIVTRLALQNSQNIIIYMAPPAPILSTFTHYVILVVAITGILQMCKNVCQIPVYRQYPCVALTLCMHLLQNISLSCQTYSLIFSFTSKDTSGAIRVDCLQQHDWSQKCTVAAPNRTVCDNQPVI